MCGGQKCRCICSDSGGFDDRKMLPCSFIECKENLSTMLGAVGLCAERPTLLWGSRPRRPNVEGPDDSADHQRDLWASPEDRERRKRKGSAQKPGAPGGKQKIGDKSRKVLGGDCEQSKVATLTSLLT